MPDTSQTLYVTNIVLILQKYVVLYFDFAMLINYKTFCKRIQKYLLTKKNVFMLDIF